MCHLQSRGFTIGCMGLCNPRHPMMLKATEEELKTLIPDPAKGIMSVGILRWAMDEVESDDPGQRAKWVKYRFVKVPHDQPSS